MGESNSVGDKFRQPCPAPEFVGLIRGRERRRARGRGVHANSIGSGCLSLCLCGPRSKLPSVVRQTSVFVPRDEYGESGELDEEVPTKFDASLQTPIRRHADRPIRFPYCLLFKSSVLLWDSSEYFLSPKPFSIFDWRYLRWFDL